MPALYFLGSRLLGKTLHNPWWSDTELAEWNEALCCPECGEIWGRVLIPGRHNWHFTVRPCPKHGEGTFIAPWRRTFQELPPEVLEYEAKLRLERFRDE